MVDPSHFKDITCSSTAEYDESGQARASRLNPRFLESWQYDLCSSPFAHICRSADILPTSLNVKRSLAMFLPTGGYPCHSLDAALPPSATFATIVVLSVLCVDAARSSRMNQIVYFLGQMTESSGFENPIELDSNQLVWQGQRPDEYEARFG